MRLAEVFRFELAYQLRRPLPWLIFAVLVVVSFLTTRDASLAEALYEDFFVNSPFAIAKTTVFGGALWLVTAAAVAGEAAARDVTTGMHPLVYTTPVRERDYLGGRFLAALALNALLLLAVPAGILVAVYSPGVEGGLVGPFRPAAYLTSYAFILLPNAFVGTAVQFSLAVRSGRPMAGYLGSLLLVFVGFFVASFLLLERGVGTLLDPIGIRFVVEDLAHSWTTVEKSWRLLELEGTVLHNRLLWLGVALAALAVTSWRFRFTHRTRVAWWRRLARRREARPPTPGRTAIAGTAIAVPEVARTFGFATSARQTLAIARSSFRALATSWAGIGLLAALPLLTVLVVLDQMLSLGVPLVPTTALVLGELTAPLSDELSRWVIVPLALVLFAGELVWRERDAGLGEIGDAMPGSAWVPLLGKLLGLGLVLIALMALLAAAGMLAQAILGHQDFEIGLYLTALFGLQLPEYLLFAVLAFAVHVLVDHKYVAHLVAIVAYVFVALASLFGVEHDLLVYGAGPEWSYTAMRGFGPSLAPWLWFKLYWAAWALLLVVVARLFWVRGRERGLGVRLRWARRRLTGPTAWAAAAAVGLVLTLGGFVFSNTNVRNEYLTSGEMAERRAEYERRYGRYEGIAQPRLTAATLHVEIHPRRRVVDVRGTYRLVNRGAAAIDTVHLTTVPEVDTGAVAFDRPAALVVADEELGHRIYALGRPLAPGESLRLDFRVHAAPHGFRESGVDDSVVANGTFFTNGWLPAIGYAEARELATAGERREHGLPPRPLVPSLDDVAARRDRDGGVAFTAVVGTDADQVAVAPGALRRTWTEGGRRTFHYASDGPIGGEWAFASADYAVREARWRETGGSGPEVAIRIFHHPGHTAHLDRVVRSVRASLDYYTRCFGPYPYGHLAIVERPGNGTGLHAEAGLLTYSEGFALWSPDDDPARLDLPFAVMAHEMAHQWTVPYAHVEGAPVMSESVAWYAAMRAVEDAYGSQVQRLLRFMRQPHPYPPIRRGEPLLRGLDPYLAYRKGPLALYALSEYVGEERVNRALGRLLETHRRPEAPLATTRDLYRELRAVTPARMRYLLHDLFEVNTSWDFRTERVTAEETAGGWQVTLDVRAEKTVMDRAGVETAVPLDDWVEVGVFERAAAGDDELGRPLYLGKHRLRSGEERITVTVPRRPARAGLDPYHLLDWDTDANVETVEIGG